MKKRTFRNYRSWQQAVRDAGATSFITSAGAGGGRRGTINAMAPGYTDQQGKYHQVLTTVGSWYGSRGSIRET